MGLKRIALVVGHTLKEPGAFSKPLNQSEYEFNIGVAQSLCTTLISVFDCNIYFRDGKTIEETYAGIAPLSPDASLEIHSNSEPSSLARGTETICALRYMNFGTLIHNSMVISLERVGREDRGLELIHPGDRDTRGWASVQNDWPQALIEPFFLSNQQDCDLFQARLQPFCLGILQGLFEWFDQIDPGFDSQYKVPNI